MYFVAALGSTEGEPLDRLVGQRYRSLLDVVGRPGVSRGQLCVQGEPVAVADESALRVLTVPLLKEGLVAEIAVMR